MARKESVTKEDLLRAAFGLAKAEGAEQVTARKLAVAAGCSTQPIFRIYKNMEELLGEVFMQAVTYFEHYCADFKMGQETPFVNLGMAYIRFAQEYKYLFQFLFLSDKRYGKSLYDLINGQSGAVGREIAKAKAAGCGDAGNLFMQMWIFIHGAACMTLTGDFDLPERDTMRLLEKVYNESK
jgi:AcrR family transcriptional regulator